MRLLSLLLVLLYLQCCWTLHCSSSPYATQMKMAAINVPASSSKLVDVSLGPIETTEPPPQEYKDRAMSAVQAIPEYTVCQTEDNSENPFNDTTHIAECNHTTMLPYAPCDTPDSSHSDSVLLCWQIRDLSQGSVEVTFPLWPQHCNYTRYDVTLMVYESAACLTPGNSIDDFKKHSRKEVTIQECTGTSCESKCSKRGSLVFRHLFSGCYQIFMTPRRHFLALQQLVSDPVLITTEYKKTSLSMLTPVVYLSPKQTEVERGSVPPCQVPPNGNIKAAAAVYTLHVTNLTLTVNFPIVPVASHLTLSYGINMSLGQHACRSTGHSFATCVTCLGSSEIQCNHAGSGSITSCSYQEENVVRCSFPGMKPGNYCVRIQYDDERCVADTVWNEISDNGHSPCTWDAFQPICGVTGFLVYRRSLPSHSNFLPVRHKPLQLSEQPTVLLLYARDCVPFMNAVAQLRLLMRGVYNCQVMDCWDESLYSSVSQSPMRWLQSLLASPRVRCVLLTSPASLLQEAALLHSRPIRYKQPRAFDSVFTHALSCLHESALQDSYKRLFIVRLDGGTEGALPKVRSYLNPLTTYVLPIHLNKLMSCIYSMDSPMCSIIKDDSPEVSLLSNAISEYRHHLENHPRYLDTLMVSDTETPLYQILT